MRELRGRLAFVAAGIAAIAFVISIQLWRERDGPETVSMRRMRFTRILAEIGLSPEMQPPLPGDGGDKWSWRFRVAAVNYPLPYWDQPAWDQCWNSRENIEFEDIGLSSYCRDDFTPVALSVRGADTALEHGFENLRSFPRNLIVLIETPRSGLHWMQPGDFELENLVADEGRRPGSDSGKDFHVGFADGTVWRMKHSLPLQNLRPFLTVSTASAANREKLLGEWRL